MEVRCTALPEVKIITPRRIGDARGYFCESWNAARMAAAGLDLAFVQDNESLSPATGTLRGLHCQAPPFAQAKLVRVTRGAILDVAVDVRRGSPSFGRWVSAEISAENGAQILVPRGFLAVTPPGRLVELPRYLRAATARVERLKTAAGRAMLARKRRQGRKKLSSSDERGDKK